MLISKGHYFYFCSFFQWSNDNSTGSSDNHLSVSYSLDTMTTRQNKQRENASIRCHGFHFLFLYPTRLRAYFYQQGISRVLLLKTGGITKTIRCFPLQRHSRRLGWQPGRFFKHLCDPAAITGEARVAEYQSAGGFEGSRKIEILESYEVAQTCRVY